MPVNTMVMPYLIAIRDDIVIANGAARLGDVGHARLARTLDVVAEREERVGAVPS